MQSQEEVLLRLLVADVSSRRRYLPETISGIAFDVGGLFVPKNAAEVVFYVGCLILDEAARGWSEEDQRTAQELSGLLWMISEYGGEILAEIVLLEGDGYSFHHDGIRRLFRSLAKKLIDGRKYQEREIERSFRDVFLKDSFLMDGG